MIATRPKTIQCLHPADVGAAIGRPRATNSRPYIFYKIFSAFCNTPLLFVICTDKMRFAKGGSRPSPTENEHNSLEMVAIEWVWVYYSCMNI
jgi:hypothetical protein